MLAYQDQREREVSGLQLTAPVRADARKAAVRGLALTLGSSGRTVTELFAATRFSRLAAAARGQQVERTWGMSALWRAVSADRRWTVPSGAGPQAGWGSRRHPGVVRGALWTR